MASVVRSQPTSLSQRGTTAPMNELPVTAVVITNPGGMAGSKAAGSLNITDRHQEPNT